MFSNLKQCSKAVWLFSAVVIGVTFCSCTEAAEEGFKEVQVSAGYKIIAEEGAEVKKNGGQIVLEDLSTSNSKKIRSLQGEIAKLREENRALKETLQKFETQLNTRLEDVKTDLAELKSEVRGK